VFTDFYVSQEIYIILIQVFILTFLIPISLFFLLLSFRKVDSIVIANINQRKIPLITNIIILFVLVNKSITLAKYPELYMFFIAAIISNVLCFLAIYIKVKASLHVLGISSLTFFAIGLSISTQKPIFYIISILFLTIGFVATSRLIIKAHSLKELLIGFIFGILPYIFLWPMWL